MYPTAISYLRSFHSSNSTSDPNSKSIFARIPHPIARMIYDFLNLKEQSQMKAVAILCERNIKYLFKIQINELAHIVSTQLSLGLKEEVNKFIKQEIEKHQKYKAPIPAKILNIFAFAKMQLCQYRKADKFFTKARIRFGNAIPAATLANTAFVKLQLLQYRRADQFFTEAIIKFGNSAPPEMLANAAFVKLRLSGCMIADLYREAYDLFNQAKARYEDTIPPDWVTEEASVAQALCERDDMKLRLYSTIF